MTKKEQAWMLAALQIAEAWPELDAYDDAMWVVEAAGFDLPTNADWAALADKFAKEKS